MHSHVLPEMCQGSRPAVPDDAAVIEDSLELGSGLRASSSGEIHLAANVGGIIGTKARRFGRTETSWSFTSLRRERRRFRPSTAALQAGRTVHSEIRSFGDQVDLPGLPNKSQAKEK